jgi:hypothetical protein
VQLAADWNAGNFKINSANILTDNINVGFGLLPLFGSSGVNNTGNFGFGIAALMLNTGKNNVAIGNMPLQGNSGEYNVAVGFAPLLSNSGNQNVAIGKDALSANIGSYSIAIGFNAGYSNDGTDNIGLGSNSINTATGSNNVGIGSHALYDVSGNHNVALGFKAGYYKADGEHNIPAADNLYLGANIRSLLSAQTNEIIIGASAIGAGSNTVTIGNTSNTRTLLTGNIENAATAITSGSGTGLTIISVGNFLRQVYKVTVTYAGFSAAALTADHTIATLPAKTKIVGFYADTTVPFTGGGVTAASLTVGKSAGGVEYIATHDVLSAAITRGLADADMGTELVAAALIQGGAVVNWTGTTTVSARLTTVTANTNALTAGSVTFYIVTERF